jgi:polar amino acid transport system substrate-binding protein
MGVWNQGTREKEGETVARHLFQCAFRPAAARFRRLARLGLALFAMLALLGQSACQTPIAGGNRASRLQDIVASGVLRVGITGTQPPLNMKNKAGEIVGFEMDLIRSLANSMGLEAHPVELPFAELLSSLEKGKVDLVISGVTITPERNTRVAFVGPYFITGKSVLTKSETLARVSETTELDDPARTYAALAGSTSEDFVREILPKATLITTPDHDTAVQMVIDGSVDAMLADSHICRFSAWRYADLGLATIATPFTIEPLGIALPADAPLLVNLVENFLDTLEYTGLLGQFKAQWLSDDAWLDELP